MSHRPHANPDVSRRKFLRSLATAAISLRAAPFFGAAIRPAETGLDNSWEPAGSAADLRYRPHYPEQSLLADILALVPPGSDSYVTERYASEIGQIFSRWGQELRSAGRGCSSIGKSLAESLEACPLMPVHEVVKRDHAGIQVRQRSFAPVAGTTPARFMDALLHWLGPLTSILVAEFEVYGIDVTSTAPLAVRIDVRYDIAGIREDHHREERVGAWQLACRQETGQAWIIHRWQAKDEVVSVGESTPFLDVTASALGGNDSYAEQLLHGVDYWRTVLDGASGIDIYANNGVAVGDFDNDGFDDLYVCQPGGLPNRLYRNRGDGTFEDVSARAGVDVLDNTACALFADFDNRGLQDLLVVGGSGPLLFRNNGDGTFTLQRDAFEFSAPPSGTFTHAALADYDNDGRLDIYFCTYQYYLGLDQYHYPVPYYDARNGPRNLLLHNEGGGRFVETTKAAGLDIENNRYSFACAWGDSNGNGLPDLCVANDFGRTQLYRNEGHGRFRMVSGESHVEEAAAGMSACWADFENSGRQDIYTSSMWEAAGQRVSQQKQFHAEADAEVRMAYRRQGLGNALYRNNGDGTFRNAGEASATAMGRWSWAADAWDFDQDGYSDLYVTNGYISAAEPTDIDSFFWRQIVANSPEDASPRLAYERAWNAINELVRADSSWNGYQRNVLFANNGDGTFAEVSSVAGLDCMEDSRSFALADIDHDGRQELILKNRNAPQVRILRNDLSAIGNSVLFRLRGHTSNRDAIGAAITLEAGPLKQTKYLQAGTGFLCQHSKELFFGVGKTDGPLKATVRWPSGATQTFDAVPINHRIEIEESGSTFSAKPFAETPARSKESSAPPPAEKLPTQVQTWLTTPLKAPLFSLTDTSGNTKQLQQWLGGSILLALWTTGSSETIEQLRHLQRASAQLRPSVSVVALNLDDPSQADSVRGFARSENFSFPILLGTPEIGGIYNIIFRYLFDRRRDLAFPTSFLIDKDGQIIKVYQGAIALDHILQDVKTAPGTPQKRMERALPFKGSLYQGTLQRNDFTYGVALFQHGYYVQAEESFQQVVALRPNDPEAYYNLGTLNLRLNRFDKAREYLQQTLKLRPDYPEALNNLGMMAAQQGQAEEAVRNFLEALKLRPDYEIALVNLGNVYRRAHAYPEAEEALKRALALQSDDPEVHYSLGMVYAQQDQLQPAAESLQRAITLRPVYPEAINNLGIVYVRLQQLDQAEQQFKTGIQLAPENDQSYLNLARLYALRGDKAKARETVQSLLQRQPQNTGALKAMEQLQ
jgi:Flp pilus assembly protein TadD/peroxiredoxin